jgi:hypothetical protein
MNRFKNHLIAAAVLSVLAIIGTIMNSRPSVLQAAGGPTVTIDPSQLPLPVQGSLGITGTANVKVTNPAAAPVLSLNVNDPGRIPYNFVATGFPCSIGVPLVCGEGAPVVPTGHRLVIQHFSGTIAFSTAPSILVAYLVKHPGSSPFKVRLSSSTPPLLTLSGWDQSVLAYFDAGDQPLFEVITDVLPIASQLTEVVFAVTLTGYLLDCTIAPCAATAP